MHLFLNSNRWWSAVSDYCFQIAAWMHSERALSVRFLSMPKGPLASRAALLGIEYLEMPLFPWGTVPFFRSWIILSRELRKLKLSKELNFVWTFEGREHSLCAIHRLANPDLWANVRLVRVRGQAASVRGTFFNRWVYSRLTDSVVFVASVVRNRVCIDFPRGNFLNFHYCANFCGGTRPWESLPSGRALAPNANANSQGSANDYNWMSQAPNIDFSLPVFVVIGRFDPVKGHAELLHAFSKMLVRSDICQLVFIGRSQNVSAAALVDVATNLLNGTAITEKVADGTRFFVQGSDPKKRLFVCDEQFIDVPIFFRRAHWGIIPSLGSEVICRVAVEFLQNGTPCLAHSVGALGEVLVGEPNLLVELGNSGMLIAKLEEAVNKVLDVEKFVAIREVARELGLKNYSWKKFPELIKWISREEN